MGFAYCTGCYRPDPATRGEGYSTPTYFNSTTGRISYDSRVIEVTTCCGSDVKWEEDDKLLLTCGFCEEWVYIHDDPEECPACEAVACTVCEEWFEDIERREHCSCEEPEGSPALKIGRAFER